MSDKMLRMWINQPSKLQPHHNLHARNVLMVIPDIADAREHGACVRIYFTEGPVVDMMIDITVLTVGWIGGQNTGKGERPW